MAYGLHKSRIIEAFIVFPERHELYEVAHVKEYIRGKSYYNVCLNHFGIEITHVIVLQDGETSIEVVIPKDEDIPPFDYHEGP